MYIIKDFFHIQVALLAESPPDGAQVHWVFDVMRVVQKPHVEPFDWLAELDGVVVVVQRLQDGLYAWQRVAVEGSAGLQSQRGTG